MAASARTQKVVIERSIQVFLMVDSSFQA